MYSISVKRSAEKDLDKIFDPDLSRILDSVEELATNPRNLQVKKLSGKENEYRLRVGDYRILFYIDEANKEIKISRVLRRKDAYKKN